jgi:hypothetical protein
MWMAPPQSYVGSRGRPRLFVWSSLSSLFISISFSFFMCPLRSLFCMLSLHTYLSRAPSPPSLLCAERSVYLKPSASSIAAMMDLHHVSLAARVHDDRNYLAMARWIFSRSFPSMSRHSAYATVMLCKWSAGSISASNADCWATGMVMVDATANTNSVTISTGIRLAAFLSSSFRNAPSSD